MENNNKFIKQNAANFITLCNMIFGATSIIMSITGRFRTAMAFIIIASIADRYDGKVARKFNQSSQLGVQMDSMGDVLSFGAAPAILVFVNRFMPLEGPIKIIGAIATIFYICAGAFRLARFNTEGMDEDNNFNGIPIPVAGLAVVALMMFGKKIPAAVLIGALFILGALMVSKVKIKKK